MTTLESDFTADAWLDPSSDTVESQRPPQVNLRQLAMLSTPVLSEALVAQRLITASQAGLVLGHELDQEADALAKWGHSLSSAVAALQPPASVTYDAKGKRERRKYQEQLLAGQLRWPDLASARNTAFLLCADHKPPEYGLPRQLYTRQRPESLLSWDSFSPLLDQLINAVSPVVAPTWVAAGSSLRESLTTIIFETFKNTHDHARDEVDGADVQTSVRAIYARFYSMDDVQGRLSTMSASGATPAERYLASFIRKTPKPGLRLLPRRSVAGFLEVSVLDSGPGMAARWWGGRADAMGRGSQLEAVLNCFQKGRSTTGSSGRGFGLWKVLLSLEQLRGFVSVRTNRIHAFRQFGYSADLSQEELSGGQRVPKEQLLDWKRGLSTAPSDYPPVKGTVVSFLLPMGDV